MTLDGWNTCRLSKLKVFASNGRWSKDNRDLLLDDNHQAGNRHISVKIPTEATLSDSQQPQLNYLLVTWLDGKIPKYFYKLVLQEMVVQLYIFDILLNNIEIINVNNCWKINKKPTCIEVWKLEGRARALNDTLFKDLSRLF